MKRKRLAIKILQRTVLFLFLLSTLLFPVSAKSMESAPQTDWSRVYFLGESTTAHLKLRGKKLGEFAKTNVLAPRSGTLMLSPRTLSQTIQLSKSGEKTVLADAIQTKKPEILVLSFGLNGISGFSVNHEKYIVLYDNLIEEIRRLSPETTVILQTIYPVAKEPLNWKFSNSPEKVNEQLRLLNESLESYANQNGILLVDTASILRNKAGFLKEEYSSDGIHLSGAGYDAVLDFLAVKMEESGI